MFGYRPPNISHTYNAQPCTKFRLFAAARVALEAMLSRRNELEIAIVPDQGHAPLLTEPKLVRRIAAFVASCPRGVDGWV